MSDKTLKIVMAVEDKATGQLQKIAMSQAQVFRQMDREAGIASRNMARSAEGVNKQTVSMAGAWRDVAKGAFMAAAAFALVESAARAAIAPWARGIESIDKLKMSAAGLAAVITGMAADKSNPAETFKQSLDYSTQTMEKLERWDALTIASGDNLRDMNSMLAQGGFILDTNNEEHKKFVLSLANAIGIFAQGQNMEIQYLQETRALMEGTAKATGRVAMYLDTQIPGGLKDFVGQVKAGKAHWEDLNQYLVGINAATGELSLTWMAMKSTMSTIVDRVLREGMAGAYADILGSVDSINKWLVDENGQLTENAKILKGDIAATWGVIKATMEEIVGLGSKAWEAWKWLGLSEKFEGMVAYREGRLPSWFGKSPESRKQLEDSTAKQRAELAALEARRVALARPASNGLLSRLHVLGPQDEALAAIERAESLAQMKLWQYEDQIKLVSAKPATAAVAPATKLPGAEPDDSALKKAAAARQAIQDAWEREFEASQKRIAEATLEGTDYRLWVMEGEKDKSLAIARKAGADLGEIYRSYALEEQSILDEGNKKKLESVQKFADDFVQEIYESNRYVLEAQKELQDLADAIIKANRTPKEIYEEQLAELAKLRDAGLLTSEIFERAKKAAGEDLADAGKSAFKDLEDAARGWGNAFTDTMADMVMTGKGSFSDLANSIIRDMIRMQIQSSITGPLLGLASKGIGALFSPVAAGAIGTVEAGVPMVNAHVGHAGGLIGSDGFPTRQVPAALFHGAPKFHSGGEVPIIAQTGERIIPRGQSVGSDVEINIIDQRRGGEPVRAQESRGPDGKRMIQILVRDTVRAGMANGEYDGAMRQNYGVGRVGISR